MCPPFPGPRSQQSVAARIVALAVVPAVVGLVPVAQATADIIGISLGSPPDTWEYNQSDAASPASQVGDTVQLTTGDNNQRSIFYKTKQDITSFVAKFSYRLEGGIFPTGKLAFVIHNNPSGVDALGSSFGYTGLSNSAALAIKATGSTGSTFAGFFTNGVVNEGSMSELGTVHAYARDVDVTMMYAGGTTISVTIVDPMQPGTPFIANYILTDPLANIVGGSTAYLGFAASTGNPAPQFLTNFSYVVPTAPTGIVALLAGLAAFGRRRRVGSLLDAGRSALTGQPKLIAATAVVACGASASMAQVGSVFVDARSNIFGYGVLSPSPGGGGGGLLAVTVDLEVGTGRTLTVSSTGSAWWGASAGSNGPDGGNFASSTNIPAVGPISGFTAPRSGHLVGLFLEVVDPSLLPAPAALPYPNVASLTAASFSPGIRQVFFIGDGLTSTGSGVTQSFNIPDTATQLVLGIADANSFNANAGFYNDNTGGYNVNFNAVPAPSACALLGIGAFVSARRRRSQTLSRSS